jgi:hypothetical protein
MPVAPTAALLASTYGSIRRCPAAAEVGPCAWGIADPCRSPVWGTRTARRRASSSRMRAIKSGMLVPKRSSLQITSTSKRRDRTADRSFARSGRSLCPGKVSMTRSAVASAYGRRNRSADRATGSRSGGLDGMV